MAYQVADLDAPKNEKAMLQGQNERPQSETLASLTLLKKGRWNQYCESTQIPISTCLPL
jgi:hypothetical protein